MNVRPIVSKHLLNLQFNLLLLSCDSLSVLSPYTLTPHTEQVISIIVQHYPDLIIDLLAISILKPLKNVLHSAVIQWLVIQQCNQVLQLRIRSQMNRLPDIKILKVHFQGVQFHQVCIQEVGLNQTPLLFFNLYSLAASSPQDFEYLNLNFWMYCCAVHHSPCATNRLLNVRRIH